MKHRTCENPQEAKCSSNMEDIYDQRITEAVEVLRKIEAFDHQKTAQDALRKGDFVSVTNALSRVAETDMQLWVRDVIRILTEENGND